MLPGALSILAVDDDPEDLDLMYDVLRDLEPGVDFNKLINGGEVLPFLESLSDNELPCLIILDYNMPEISGADILLKLCKLPRYKAIPKVVLSTSNASMYIKQCMNNGAAEYFVKPSSMRELKGTMQKILDYCKPKKS